MPHSGAGMIKLALSVIYAAGILLTLSCILVIIRTSCIVFGVRCDPFCDQEPEETIEVNCHHGRVEAVESMSSNDLETNVDILEVTEIDVNKNCDDAAVDVDTSSPQYEEACSSQKGETGKSYLLCEPTN